MKEPETYSQPVPRKSPDSEPVISIRDLAISFGEQQVLKGISLELFKGENLVVLGKSGTGKSVLIKCISRLLIPDDGKITVLGKEITGLQGKELAETRKKIGFLFQSGALYDSMSVKENLEFPLKRMFRGMKRAEMDQKVIEALRNVGLESALHKMPSELSGGMRKRIALARTIIVDPAIILYDEPTTGLDPITSAEISELINEIQDKYRTSSIVITHDMPCARTVANRVIILKDGLIHDEGTLEDLEKRDDEWMKLFFGKAN
jgi:phospholipid/cholesterol/gamma-HCH transport system ATP-binding protein